MWQILHCRQKRLLSPLARNQRNRQKKPGFHFPILTLTVRRFALVWQRLNDGDAKLSAANAALLALERKTTSWAAATERLSSQYAVLGQNLEGQVQTTSRGLSLAHESLKADVAKLAHQVKGNSAARFSHASKLSELETFAAAQKQEIAELRATLAARDEDLQRQDVAIAELRKNAQDMAAAYQAMENALQALEESDRSKTSQLTQALSTIEAMQTTALASSRTMTDQLREESARNAESAAAVTSELRLFKRRFAEALRYWNTQPLRADALPAPSLQEPAAIAYESPPRLRLTAPRYAHSAARSTAGLRSPPTSAVRF